MAKSRSLIVSFRASAAGFFYALRGERNMRLHALAATLAVLLAGYLGFSLTEWVLLVVVIGFVLALELINTTVERILDTLIAEHHPGVKVIKDVMAAAVLVAALTAAAAGALLFIPKIAYLN